MTPEAAKRVVALLEHMDYFPSAKTMTLMRRWPPGVSGTSQTGYWMRFVDAVYAQRVGSGEGIANLKLFTRRLNGAGLECVKKLTQKLGIRNMTIVKSREQPDGHFSGPARIRTRRSVRPWNWDCNTATVSAPTF